MFNMRFACMCNQILIQEQMTLAGVQPLRVFGHVFHALTFFGAIITYH